MKLLAFCHLAHCSFLERYKKWLLQPEYQVDYYKAVWAQPILAVVVVRSPEAQDIFSPKERPSGNTAALSLEWGLRRRLEEWNLVLDRWSLSVGWGTVSLAITCLRASVVCVCVCVCVCSILALEESERDPKSLRCPDKPVLLRLWQNGRELSLNAHRHNTDRLTICNEIRSKYFCVRRYGIGAQPYVLGVLMESARNWYTVVRRMTTFRSTTDPIYDGGKNFWKL